MSLFNDIKNRAVQSVIGIADSLLPTLKESKFRETGLITPDEFVAAGNFLVHHCPTWQWASGDKSKLKDYLPPDKQYLITKNVPCTKRCKHLMDVKENLEKVIEEESGDGGWVDTHHFAENKEENNIEDIEAHHQNKSKNESVTSGGNVMVGGGCGGGGGDEDDEEDDDDEPIDMESYDHNVVDDDEATVVVKPTPQTSNAKASASATNNEQSTSSDQSTTIPTRTYDLNITYDNYYRTPRLWLCGYDENQKPLTVDQMYEDISEDHARKTVTIEAHPHIPGTHMASIHPCRHAEVMKKLINLVAESGKELEVYSYLMVFLKFVQSVIPTIEYDYTRNVLI